MLLEADNKELKETVQQLKKEKVDSESRMETVKRLCKCNRKAQCLPYASTCVLIWGVSTHWFVLRCISHVIRLCTYINSTITVVVHSTSCTFVLFKMMNKEQQLTHKARSSKMSTTSCGG